MTGGFPVEPALRFLVELVLIGAAAWFVFVRLGTSRQLSLLGRAPLLAFWLLMLSWLGVQLVDRMHLYYPQYSSYYPLTRFAMYEAGDPAETVPGHYVAGTLPDGDVVHLDLAAWLPSVEATALDNRFVVLIRWLRSGETENVARADREITGYLSGVRTIMAEAGEPVPTAFSLHATTHRMRDAALVADSVVWASSSGGLVR